MKNNIRDYVNIIKLNKENNPNDFEKKGKGYFYTKEGAKTFMYHNGEPMRCLLYIEYEPMKPRGNHIHKKKTENHCVVKGKIKVKCFLPESPTDILEIVLEEGDIISLKPGCVHSFCAENQAVSLEFSAQPFELDDYKYYKIE